MLAADDVLGFNNVWRDQNFFYNITDHISTNYFDCRGHHQFNISYLMAKSNLRILAGLYQGGRH